MKRINLLCVVVLGLLGLLTPGVARAQFLFVTNNGSITITGYTGPGGNVVIPSEANGLPVTGIGDYAFNSGPRLELISPSSPFPVLVTLPLGVQPVQFVPPLGQPVLRPIQPQSIQPIQPILSSPVQTSSILSSPAVIPHAVMSKGITGIIIPGSITNIGSFAFSFCTNLTLVTISNGLVRIGDGAFYECTRLPQVIIPGSVTAIGNNAFNDCTKLTGIKIPNSVASIGTFAFFGCSNLVSVSIGSGVTNIAPAAFGQCLKLPAITVDAANADYTSSNGVLFDKSLDTLEEYPGGKAGIYTIPSRVTLIASDAFDFCTKLTGVSIPSTVTCISSNAFVDCDKLTGIVIPNSVTNLGLNAFYGCIGLTKVTIGSGVTNIVGGTFSECPQLLSFVVNTQNACYRSANGVLFNENMTTLVECPPGKRGKYIIPNGVTSIADAAFSNCAKLSNITIPDSIASIGSDAFLGCMGLTRVTIPNDVTSIGPSAFNDCTSLASLTIGSGVTNIAVATTPYGLSEGIFTDCPKLVSVTVDADNAYYSSTGGVLFDKNKTTLLQYPASLKGSYSIPGSVNDVSVAAFRGCTFLSSVTIPDGVTNLDDFAFYGCTRLKSVTIPNSVISIGNEAFSDCTSLTNVNFGAGIATVQGDPFYGCTNLTAIYFSGNAPADLYFFSAENPAPTIYYQAGTSGWSDLTFGVPTIMLNAPNPAGSLQVTITPSDAVTVGAQWQVDGELLQPGGATVSGLSVGLHTVSFTSLGGWTAPASQIVDIRTNSVTYVQGSYVFNGPPQFLCTTNPDNTLTIIGYLGQSGDGTIPGFINGHTVASIGDNALQQIGWFTNLVIPGSITNIGEFAFSGCTNLTSVTIMNGVANIGEWTFEGCYSLTSAVIPGSVSSIGDYSFYGCNLTNLVISNGVASIGDSAFFANFSLKCVTIPGSVTNVGNDAFNDCQGLASVTISNGVTSIGSDVFEGCGALTSVFIPASVTNMGPVDFAYCSSLTNIAVDPLNPDYASAGGILFNKTLTTLLEYPAGDGFIIYAIPGTVTSIGDEAFEGCATLYGVTIPGSVTNIESEAFENCGSFTSIAIPVSVTSIDDSAFSACWGMTNISVDAFNPDYASTNGVLFDKGFKTLLWYPMSRAGSYVIPNGVTSIGPNAFEYCSSLTNVTIPGSVTSIGPNAFASCSSLTDVTIPGSVINIGDEAFSGDYNLTNVTILNGVTSIGNGTFSSCGLVSITIPNTVKTINDYAFESCWNLASVTIPNSVTSLGYSAFADCMSLTNVTIGIGLRSINSETFDYCSSLVSVYIPASVTNLDYAAFGDCTSLTKIFFGGNAPSLNTGTIFIDGSPFTDDSATVYYVPGTRGWSNTFGGLPIAPWPPRTSVPLSPSPRISSHSFVPGAQNKQFGFMISGAENASVVVEACTNLANPVWLSVQTNTLVNGTNYFSDAYRTNCPGRFYRVRPQ